MNQVMDALLNRRSCKKYLSTPVPRDVVAQIVRAGSYAPSAHGKQSGKIVVITDPGDIADLETRNAEFLGRAGVHTFYGAPLVLAVLADASSPTGVQDGSLIIGNMLLAAYSLGLGACWINRAREEFDAPSGKALLKKWGISEDVVGIGYCVVGYRAEAPKQAAPRKADYVIYPCEPQSSSSAAVRA